jgi:hypothetical protein
MGYPAPCRAFKAGTAKSDVPINRILKGGFTGVPMDFECASLRGGIIREFRSNDGGI